MKKAILLALALGAVGTAMAQPAVSVSIGVNAPGVYGQINIGSPPPAPALLMPQAVVAGPVVVGAPAMYLYVSDAERRDWRHSCFRYHACGRPVYFVREDWVRDRYAHEHPGWHDPHGAPERAERGRPDHGDRGDRGHDNRGHDDRDHRD